jgi:hypothetical protein
MHEAIQQCQLASVERMCLDGDVALKVDTVLYCTVQYIATHDHMIFVSTCLPIFSDTTFPSISTSHLYMRDYHPRRRAALQESESNVALLKPT